MKKLIGLSLALCMLIAMVSGFGVFAADAPAVMDFDDITLNVTADTEEGAALLNNATGWTLNTISGTASISTVTATDVNAEWTGRGKVLKLSGSSDSDILKITVPNSYTYNNDKWVLEYDLFVPSALVGQINIFGNNTLNTKFTYNGNFAEWYNFARNYSAENGPTPLGAALNFSASGVWGKWYKWTYIFDNANVVNGTFNLTTSNGSEPISNLPTLTVYKTDLSTGVKTQVDHSPAPLNNHSGNLLLGGNTYGNTDNNTVLKDTFYVDNLSIYTVDKFVFASSADDAATGYEIDKEYVEFAMNKAVAPASVAGITVSGVESATAAVQADGKTVRVTFNDDLVYGTTYTVDFSGITDTDGTPIESTKKTISFSTKAAPDLYFKSNALYKGVGAYAVPAATIAANDIYTIEATIKNTATSASQATVICAIYDASGRLVDTILVGKTVADEEKIGTGLTVPASATGGEVKVFLWKNMTSMQAYVKPLTVDIQ